MRVSLQEVSKSFGANVILDTFSLEVPSGSRLCLCGENGSGKSTMLRLLVGKEPLDSGRIIIQRNCRVGYVEQELALEDLKLSLLEYVLAVLPDWDSFWHKMQKALDTKDEARLQILFKEQADLEERYGYNPEVFAKSILSGLGFAQNTWTKRLSELSGGWRERAKLARVLTQGADVLLLDEPTNHLDIDAVEWLEKFLLDYKGTLIFVAHDRVFMDKIGTHVLFFYGTGKPIFRKATFSKFLELQAEIEEQQQKETSRLHDEIGKKLDFIKRFGAKASKARQASSRQKAVKKLEKELISVDILPKKKEFEFTWPSPSPCERTVLSVKDLSFSYGAGQKLWERLSFSLYRGQKIALVGANGSGKSTLLKLIVGRLEKNSGSIVLSPSVKLGYFSQHQLDTLDAEGTVLGEIRRLSDPRTKEEELMSVLGLFQLGQNYFERSVLDLSGGERARLVLASLFLSRSNFLVLDEPTNHLDLESREALVEALKRYTGTVLMVAHERYLLDSVAEELWEIEPYGIKAHVDGFAAYRQAVKESKQELNALSGEKSASSAVENALGIPISRSLSREEAKLLKREQAEARKKFAEQMKPLRTEYEKLRASFEQDVLCYEELEKRISHPDFYSDNKKPDEEFKQYHQLEKVIEEKMQRLEELEGEITFLEKENKTWS